MCFVLPVWQRTTQCEYLAMILASPLLSLRVSCCWSLILICLVHWNIGSAKEVLKLLEYLKHYSDDVVIKKKMENTHLIFINLLITPHCTYTCIFLHLRALIKLKKKYGHWAELRCKQRHILTCLVINLQSISFMIFYPSRCKTSILVVWKSGKYLLIFHNMTRFSDHSIMLF